MQCDAATDPESNYKGQRLKKRLEEFRNTQAYESNPEQMRFVVNE